MRPGIQNIRKFYKLKYFILATCLVLVSISSIVYSQNTSDGDFALQVTPSPLIATVKPTQNSKLELKIRNAGSSTEQLQAKLQNFTVSKNNEEVNLIDDSPSDVADWVKINEPSFTIQSGEWHTLFIEATPPQDAGFAYSFAVVISRSNTTRVSRGQQSLEGSVAVFALLSVDRPGATRSFQIQSLSATKRVYEYLPASLSLDIKNTGNTFVKPTGNVFIQRSSYGEPLAVLPLNSNDSNIFPETNRVINVNWDDGFPKYINQSVAAGEPPEQKLLWEWKNVQKFRFGRYIAKVVAVYNDGNRDVPVITEVSFWVIPWKIFTMIFIIVLICMVGIITIVRKIYKSLKKSRK